METWWPSSSADPRSTSPRKGQTAARGNCGRASSAASRTFSCLSLVAPRWARSRHPQSHRAPSGSVTSATSPPAVTGSTPRNGDACTARLRLLDRPVADRLPGPHQVSLKKGSTTEPKLPLASSRPRLAGMSAHSCPAPLAGAHVVSTPAGGAVEVTRPGPFTWATGDLTLLPAAALP